MSWVGWLFLLTGLYFLVVAVRGAIQLVSWLVDEYIIEPRLAARPKETASQRPREGTTPAAKKQKTKEDQSDRENRTAHRPMAGVAPPRSSRSGALARRLKLALAGRHYDDWVAAALSEEDLSLKVRYLSKALKLNPTYLPAWGMKGNALFDLARYKEAVECFDKSLELHPSALVWYKKGLCSHRAGRREEALRCLDEASKICPSRDRQLADDVARLRSLVHGELRAGQAS